MLTIQQPTSAAAARQHGLALQAAGQPATWVAGGTALQLAWGSTAPTGTLIDVRRLPEAQGVAVLPGGAVRIGAAMPLEVLRRDALVQLHAGLLAQACAAVGAMGVRHLATLGGNIGWRFGDALVALLALQVDAELADGRCLPLATLLAATPPGDGLPLLLAVHLRPRRAPALAVFEKLGQRAAFSPSLATLALLADQDAAGRLSGLHIAAGAAGLPARPLLHTAASLQGALPAAVDHGGLRLALLHDLPDVPGAPGAPDVPDAPDAPDPPAGTAGPAPLLRRVLARLLTGHLATLPGPHRPGPRPRP